MKDNGLSCETLDEWRAIVMEFRERFCDRRIMLSKTRRESVVHGFTVMWSRLRLPLPDSLEAEKLFEAAMSEYTARETLITANPPKEE